MHLLHGLWWNFGNGLARDLWLLGGWMGLKVETEYQTEDGPQSWPNKSSLERDWRDNRKTAISLWVLEMLTEFILSLSLANSRVIKISVYYIYNGKKNVHIPATGYFFEKKVSSQSLESHMVSFQSIFNIKSDKTFIVLSASFQYSL